jgi:two-component system, LytTR family, response regulator
MKIKCLVVDDEPLAIQLLEHHIQRIPMLEVAATAPNALRAFELLATESFDLLFLDIKMPHLTGIEFLKSLKHPPQTIITTAYRDFAFEGFELEVADYLLKPITFERFLRSVERVMRKQELPSQPLAAAPEKQFVILKSGAKNHKVSLDEILYIESLKDYVRVFLDNGKSIVTKQKISDLETELGGADFIRIHRSYIVNGQKITAFTATDVEIGKVEIPIGAMYRAQLEAYMG